MKVWKVGMVMALLVPLGWAAEVKVASLHPLLTDLAKRVGGERVVVVDLLGAGGDPHKFEPGARELQAAAGAQLYLVSGKGLEPYLPKLKDIVGAERVMEVGEKLPTLKAEVLCDHGEHAHVHEMDDPHWWHSVDCWRRAARYLRDELVRIDPDHAAEYRANAKKVRDELLDLRDWIAKELSTVPPEHRILASAHAAFAYFCNENQWRMLAVQGLNREQVAAPGFMAEVGKVIKEEKIRAVFPEQRSNPKALKTLEETVGVKVGPPLIADGGDSIEAMFRHNVKAIVAVLGPDRE